MPRRSNFQVKLLRSRAELEFVNAMKKWESDVEASTAERLSALEDPKYVIESGLPSEMPIDSKKILAHVGALDTLGPQMPKRRDFYERYGV